MQSVQSNIHLGSGISFCVHLWVVHYICATQMAYRNGSSVYICARGVMEYCVSENVTPV